MEHPSFRALDARQTVPHVAMNKNKSSWMAGLASKLEYGWDSRACVDHIFSAG